MEHDLERGQQMLQHGTANRGWLTKIKRLFQRDSSSQHERMQLYARCPFCRLQANVERRLIERLIGLLRSNTIPELLRQSTGLCRVHFAQALQYAAEHASEQCAVLVAGQQECVQRVHSELREAIRKHDYRFRHEAQGEEMTAWRRAAEICAGNPGVLS
ncbi:MAG: hypothetical protein IMW89_14670 [Ktedonobacteraceae bacterium]|nr:hypothetical protein [Ktedonobacteraceae bacterium]